MVDKDVDDGGGSAVSAGREIPDFGDDMLTDCGVDAGFADLSYKLSKDAMESGLLPLISDSQVLEMCCYLNTSRMLNLYCETSEETQTQYPSTQTPYFVDDPNTRDFERKQFEALFELEEIDRGIIDINVLVDCLCGKENPREENSVMDNVVEDDPIEENAVEVSDHEHASFHEDNSNIDSADDDVRSHKKKKSVIVDVPVHTENWIPDNVESDFSDCVMSDEERMVANNTDDEDGEQGYTAFHEDNDEVSFEIGLTFASADNFGKTVKNRAIKDMRAIKQVRNYSR
ncbi:hypothetical protein DCAR_0518592 [Daucus carota subsp. sativus]|uniref:Uncharacterized protein n=1 Tax=Daucus carota subsp. sativus TaxID=79200 RepID=A0A162A044_DAUCS|nr:hypothetical protein DCAR_0518592 [Daucus carota subsp. sativus]